MCIFKNYSDILGKPNTGIHSVRFLNTAIIDYILTILLAIFLTWLTDIPLVLTTIFCFLLGILFHVLFGVKTNTTEYLGISC